MKIKITKFLAIIGLVGMITVSCEKDQKPEVKPTVKEQEQKQGSEQEEMEAKFPVTGNYFWDHGSFVFKEKECSYNNFGIEKADLISIHKNKNGIIKAVLKDSTTGKFLALFLNTKSTLYHMDVNIDFANSEHNFSNVEDAINLEYPSPPTYNGYSSPSHFKMGWIGLMGHPLSEE